MTKRFKNLLAISALALGMFLAGVTAASAYSYDSQNQKELPQSGYLESGVYYMDHDYVNCGPYYLGNYIKVAVNMNGHTLTQVGDNKEGLTYNDDRVCFTLGEGAELSIYGGGEDEHTLWLISDDEDDEPIPLTTIKGASILNYDKGIEIEGDRAILRMWGVAVCGSSSSNIYADSDNWDIGLENCEIAFAREDSGIRLYDGKVKDSEHAVLTLNNCDIHRNLSDGDGGGIFAKGKFIRVLLRDGTNIHDNRADGDGGGVYLNGESAVFSAIETTLSGNIADDDGGGVYVDAGTVYYDHIHLNSAVFEGNYTCSGHGGGLYYSAHHATHFSSSTYYGPDHWNAAFKDNSAAGKGGAVYLDCNTSKFRECTFTGNEAEGDGGAVYYDGEKNISEDDFLEFWDSSFSGNKGKNGGAIFSDADELRLVRTEVSNNTASLYGGGIYYNKTDYNKLEDSSVTGNYAGANYPCGNGIYSDNSELLLKGVNVIAYNSNTYDQYEDFFYWSNLCMYGGASLDFENGYAEDGSEIWLASEEAASDAIDGDSLYGLEINSENDIESTAFVYSDIYGYTIGCRDGKMIYLEGVEPVLSKESESDFGSVTSEEVTPMYGNTGNQIPEFVKPFESEGLAVEGEGPVSEGPDGEELPEGENPDGEELPEGENPDGEELPEGENPDGEVLPEGEDGEGEGLPEGEGSDGEGLPEGEGSDGAENPEGEGTDGEEDPGDTASMFAKSSIAVFVAAGIAVAGILFAVNKKNKA
jgi:parallel beta-helix repeat protein/predicted outer membrane repeat protein